MILTTKLLIEKSRMWPDRQLAIVKLDVKKTFDQLHRSTVAPALNAAGVPPEVVLGLIQQITGAKVVPVVGGRCCTEVPVERRIREGSPESMHIFVLVLCHCIGPLVHKMVRTGLVRGR